jgi:hypothetical protein
MATVILFHLNPLEKSLAGSDPGNRLPSKTPVFLGRFLDDDMGRFGILAHHIPHCVGNPLDQLLLLLLGGTHHGFDNDHGHDQPSFHLKVDLSSITASLPIFNETAIGTPDQRTTQAGLRPMP